MTEEMDIQAGAVDFKALYERVSKVKPASYRPPDLFKDSICLAHARLLDTLLEAAAEEVQRESAAGYACATLFEWTHDELFDGVDILYLIRGPRRGAFQRPSQRRGVPGPILPLLREALAPFRVIHEWDVAAHKNRLLIRWP